MKKSVPANIKFGTSIDYQLWNQLSCKIPQHTFSLIMSETRDQIVYTSGSALSQLLDELMNE